MESKLVSVITPCYNGEQFVSLFFDNILQQSYSNIELIFINDGSTDRTEDIALSYRNKLESKIHSFVYLYQENAGQAEAVNKGIKIFKGDYLMWTDSDDILHRDNISKKVAYMEEHPEVGLAQCYGREVMEDKPDVKIRDFRRVPPIGQDDFFEDLLMKRNVEFTPGLYIARREAFLKVNPKRTIYAGRTGQNYQMLLPLAYHYQCGYIEEDLFSYVIRKDSHSHDEIEIEEFVRRSYMAKQTVEATLRQIDMKDNDLAYYLNKLEEKTIRDQFDAGYAFNDIEVLEKMYKELGNEGVRSKRDTIVYYSAKHPSVNRLFLFSKLIKKNSLQILHRIRGQAI